MTFSRKRNRSRKKFRGRKKRSRTSSGQFLSIRPSGGLPLPLRLRTHFKLKQFRLYNAAVEQDQIELIKINDMYDPMITGSANTQPGMFDELMLLYGTFRVHKCKVTMQIVNSDDVSGNIISWYASEDSTDITVLGGFEDIGNQHRSRSIILGPENGGRNMAKVSSTYVMKDYQANRNIGNTTGTVSSSPQNPVYLCIYAKNIEEAALHKLSFVFTLEWDVTLTNAILVPTS